MTDKKLRSLDRQIQELKRTQRYTRQLVRMWRAQLARAPGGKAMLLHSLAGKAAPMRPGNNLKRRRKV